MLLKSSIISAHNASIASTIEKIAAMFAADDQNISEQYAAHAKCVDDEEEEYMPTWREQYTSC